MKRDVFIVSNSDFHSGGLTALFPNYPMRFEYDEKNVLSYTPTAIKGDEKENCNQWGCNRG